MNKKIILSVTGILVIAVICTTSRLFFKKKPDEHQLTASVIKTTGTEVTIQDNNNIIYTMNTKNNNTNVGDSIIVKYTGILDKNTELQTSEVISLTKTFNQTNETGIPTAWLDSGIFSKYYNFAFNKLQTLSLDEKIGQLLLVRLPDTNAIEDLKKYHFGGFVFFEKDFKNKTEAEVKDMIKELQTNSRIPLLTAVDEEGGKVVRISSNPNLVDTKFKSSQELYNIGGFDEIAKDTVNKSKILNNLGLNVNLAPVVDVSTNPSDYMYDRSLGKNTDLTSTYAKTVIEASKKTNVSYTLKHFPGYGNNPDTHTSSVMDNRPLADIKANDLPPFASGINALAEAVLFSHNTIVNIDPDNPASLSPSVHNLLRNDLGFTGIIMTDDIDMGATTSINNKAVKALQAGNDLIITTDYENSFNDIKAAVNNGTISEDLINKLTFRVLAWKYYKGLLYDELK